MSRPSPTPCLGPPPRDSPVFREPHVRLDSFTPETLRSSCRRRFAHRETRNVQCQQKHIDDLHTPSSLGWGRGPYLGLTGVITSFGLKVRSLTEPTRFRYTGSGPPSTPHCFGGALVCPWVWVVSVYE